MKKAGFTLAEVLITLAIIGVVATMTLPALMTNTQEQQAKTGLKKGINTLTEAAQSNLAIEGFDFGNVKAASTDDPTEQSIAAILQNRTQVNYQITKFDGQNDQSKIVDNTSANTVVFLRDGSAISFPKAAPTADAFELQSDGLPKGIAVVYDYNGLKKPNQLSNCDNKPALVAGGTNKDVSTACTKANRVIKDQFGLRLRGSYVVPNGAAARWAYDN